MNLFGNTPQEQAMQSLIHDSRNADDQLRDNISRLSDWFKQNGKAIGSAGISFTAPFVYLEYLKTARKRINDSIDLYYERFKKDFPDATNQQQEVKP